MAKPADLKSKYLGGMVGSALGDAIGELAFRYSTETELLARIEQSVQLIYTDDTAMALGLAQSLLETGIIDEQHLGDMFRANYRREPWRGYASGPPTIFSLVDRWQMPYTDAARSLFGGEGSFGNGAAMRIAPVGLFFHDSPKLDGMARASASVTHAHPVGMDGAAVLARAIAEVVPLASREPFPTDQFCQHLIDSARTQEMRDKIRLVRTLLTQHSPPSAAAGILGQSVAVDQSLPFALYAFLQEPESFQACLFCAVLHGGDRDTLGAMACAVSGAYLGVDAIPLAWRAKLENLEQIVHLAERLTSSNRRPQTEP